MYFTENFCKELYRFLSLILNNAVGKHAFLSPECVCTTLFDTYVQKNKNTQKLPLFFFGLGGGAGIGPIISSSSSPPLLEFAFIARFLLSLSASAILKKYIRSCWSEHLTLSSMRGQALTPLGNHHIYAIPR